MRADQTHAVLKKPSVFRFAQRQRVAGGALKRHVLNRPDQARATVVLEALSDDMNPYPLSVSPGGWHRQVDRGAVLGAAGDGGLYGPLCRLWV